MDHVNASCIILVILLQPQYFLAARGELANSQDGKQFFNEMIKRPSDHPLFT